MSARGILIIFVVGIGCGLGAGFTLWRPKVVVETPAPAVRQKDSSLVLQRAPDAHAKPAQIVPKGAVVERVVHVDVQPSAAVSPSPVVPQNTVVSSQPVGRAEVTPDTQPVISGSLKQNSVLCPPVGVDFTLLRMKDGSHRVVASSPNGTVLNSSIDIPVENTTAPKVLKWAVGGIYGDAGRYGAYVGHDVGGGQIIGGGMYSARAKGAAFIGGGLRF